MDHILASWGAATSASHPTHYILCLCMLVMFVLGREACAIASRLTQDRFAKGIHNLFLTTLRRSGTSSRHEARQLSPESVRSYQAHEMVMTNRIVEFEIFASSIVMSSRNAGFDFDPGKSLERPRRYLPFAPRTSSFRQGDCAIPR